MSWLGLLWPWSQLRRDRAERIRLIDARFQKQLAVAEKRHASLVEVVAQIREERAKREAEAVLAEAAPPEPESPGPASPAPEE